MSEESRPAPEGEKRDESLSRASRIRSRRDFQTIYADRRTIRNRNLTFFWRAAPGDRSRLGVAVGKRVGNAVERNRVKRVLREVFRRERHGFSRPLDLVVIPRGYRTGSDFEEMTSSFRHLQEKLEKEIERGLEG